MAHALIGGLSTSTILTLVVVPVMYTLLDDLPTFRRHLRKAPDLLPRPDGAPPAALDRGPGE